MQHSRRSELVGTLAIGLADARQDRAYDMSRVGIRGYKRWQSRCQLRETPAQAGITVKAFRPNAFRREGMWERSVCRAPVPHCLLRGRDRWTVPQMRNDFFTRRLLADPNGNGAT